jgi:hypothetical protein
LVVLRWLARQLRPSRRYPEAVVNAVLGRIHPDFATLRRLLVDEELMQRQRGLYWRAGSLAFLEQPEPFTGSLDRSGLGRRHAVSTTSTEQAHPTMRERGAEEGTAAESGLPRNRQVSWGRHRTSWRESSAPVDDGEPLERPSHCPQIP